MGNLLVGLVCLVACVYSMHDSNPVLGVFVGLIGVINLVLVGVDE